VPQGGKASGHEGSWPIRRAWTGFNTFLDTLQPPPAKDKFLLELPVYPFAAPSPPARPDGMNAKQEGAEQQAFGETRPFEQFQQHFQFRQIHAVTSSS
jgi:hypothetical protein